MAKVNVKIKKARYYLGEVSIGFDMDRCFFKSVEDAVTFFKKSMKDYAYGEDMPKEHFFERWQIQDTHNLNQVVKSFLVFHDIFDNIDHVGITEEVVNRYEFAL